MLRKYLDDVPLWRGEHVAVTQLVVDFARYLYLPRLVGPEVLVAAMRDGVALLTWQFGTFAVSTRQTARECLQIGRPFGSVKDGSWPGAAVPPPNCWRSSCDVSDRTQLRPPTR